MPVYEYLCAECGERFEIFMRSMTHRAAPVCPRCGSEHVHKSISLFGVGGAGESKGNAVSCNSPSL